MPVNEGINKKQLKSLIDWTLKEIGLYSVEASMIVHGTIAYESLHGHFIKQTGGGPAQGIGQVEPYTEYDCWERYLKYKPELALKIINASSVLKPKGALLSYATKIRLRIYRVFGQYLEINRMALQGNLIYSICMVRVKYLRDPHKIPSDLEGQAKVYKRWYNTPKGSGSVNGYIDSYRAYCE